MKTIRGRQIEKDGYDARIDEFGSYTGPSIIAIAVVIGIFAMILFYNSSPRVGVLSAGAFLLAVVGVAAFMQKISSWHEEAACG